MGDEDALLWRAGRDPGLRSTTAAIALLDRAPDPDSLVSRLARATREIPRLRQRVIDLPRAISTPVWAFDPHFDLGYHLSFVRAAGDGSLRALLDFAAHAAMRGFDPARPLWEFVVVEELEDGRAALVQKLHHAVTDGVGGALLMQRVYDREGGEHEPPAPSSRRPAAPETALGLLAEALAESLARESRRLRRAPGQLVRAALHPLAAARAAVEDLRSLGHVLAPKLGPLSPVMRDRSARYRFDAFGVSLEALKSAAHAAGGRLNDAFLAALASGWRRYHARQGAPVARLRMTLPISLRTAGSAAIAGNRILLSRLDLPVGGRDPRRRIRRIHRLVAAERAQPARSYVEEIARLLNLLPAAVLVPAFGMLARSSDFVASCVPGVPFALRMAGARVESFFAFGPPAGSAANVTLFSYLDEATVGINADPAAVAAPALLTACMREGFDEVLKLG
jgi:WS/DGAT/MGAT family acyltransferase